MQVEHRIPASARPDAPFDRFQRVSHFGSLDALRALAVVAVVWHHAGGHVPGALGRGYLGVELFFVISGFLITTLLLRELDGGSISLRRFYLRRSLRIFPLYYATLGLYAVLTLVAERDGVASAGFWHNLPAFATYTFNWLNTTDPTDERILFFFAWSLATAEQFYLFWPQLLARVPLRVARRVMVAATATVLTLDLVVWTGPAYGDPLPIRIARSVPFALLLGVCLGLALHDRRWFERLWAVLGRPAAGPLALALTGLLVWQGAPDHAVVLGFAALVTATVITEFHPLATAARSRPLVEIGKVSYGVYLLHSLSIGAIERAVGAEPHPALVFAVALPLSIGLAQLSFRHLERPFLRLKDRYRSGADRRPGPVPVAPVEVAG